MSERVHVLIGEEDIKAKIKEIAEKITQDYAGTQLTLICILKGGVIFMVDLARQIKLPCAFEFMDISSYGNSSTSSGVVKIERDLDAEITGKHVILVEDIIDTGRTLSRLKEHLLAQRPASFKICALLDKVERREVPGIAADYTGFVIPNEFVVGYGLDYSQRYRNLPFVGRLEFL
ncbi:MAG: hypoxanthine phosphoribosyltransferase [Clostridiales bacterium]|jgi:hypoxanthine phosphoribosyltransferase|nr:hypoxanthine phosphoribosyltransferase [Clostridiales bacterium]